MTTFSIASRAPRRNPSQTRSVVTVSAIFEASIQVLLKDGVHRLTTTRVAERAGVSVGTLYQYYPNKQALLHAVLQRHLDGVAAAVEVAARKAHHQSLAIMVESVVRAFVKAKIERPDEARALYAVAAELGCADLVKQAGVRAGTALAAMLSTATDAKFNELLVVSYMFATAMTGPTKGILEEQAPPKLMRVLRSQLVSLCLGYLEREALSVARAQKAV
ncbi:MAG: TetR/AcrR family transcriptional regulator [Rhodoferax sp.]|nr:TetR/AcrR family transcriptional regulator [Rhodoferax sp.]